MCMNVLIISVTIIESIREYIPIFSRESSVNKTSFVILVIRVIFISSLDISSAWSAFASGVFMK